MNETTALKTRSVYIGAKSCGCAVAIIRDEPQYQDDIASSLAEWIRDGLTVERVTADMGIRRFQAACEHGESLPTVTGPLFAKAAIEKAREG